MAERSRLTTKARSIGKSGELAWGDTEHPWDEENDSSNDVTFENGIVRPSRSIPRSIVNNAYGWYDASNLNLSAGSAVSTRPDDSGNGNDVSGDGTFQSAAVNGEAAVLYDGADDFHFTSVSVGAPKTWFVVFRWDGGTSEYNFQGILGDGGSKNNRNMFGLTEDTGEWNIKIGENDYYGGITDRNWHVGTFKNDGSNGFGRVDGVEFAAGSDGGYTASENIVVGARDTGNPVYFSGSVAEAIFVGADVSQSDIEQTERTLADEYGISL